MAYFSYIDTALRVIHINRRNEGGVERSKVLNDLFSNLNASPDIKEELTLENIRYNLQSPEFKSLMIHESHHYWQSLFYPYLFYINFLEFHTLSVLRLQFETLPDQVIELDKLKVVPKIHHNLYYCSDNFLYRWKPDGLLEIITENITADSRFQSDTFSINDLIEDATTIFQYKALHTDASDENYFRWSQNPVNRGYKKLYKFLTKKMGRSYAYHFIPILVQLAFHTTEPASMFMNLVNITIQFGLNKGPFSKSDYAIVKEILQKFIEPVDFSVDEMLLINDMPVGFITPDFHRQVIDYAYSNPTSVHYPLSVHGKKHIDLVSKDLKWEEALINVRHDNFSALMDAYYPFAIHFNFIDQKTKDTAILTASPDYKNIVIKGELIDYSYIIKEQLNLQDVTINLFFDIHRETPNQCDHSACSLYQLQLCKKWNSVPIKYEDCRFPYWFPIHFHYKINPRERRLERATELEMKAHQEEYIRLRKVRNQTRFSYHFHSNYCELRIRRSEVEKKDLRYIPDFIDEQLKEKNVEVLASFLVLKFHGFAEDTRHVFEIPEIRDYMSEVFQMYPWLFYFLDLSDAHTQSYIFPFFIPYKCHTKEDGSYEIFLMPVAFDNFIKKTMYNLGAFAQRNALEIPKVIDNFLYQLNTKNGSKI